MTEKLPFGYFSDGLPLHEATRTLDQCNCFLSDEYGDPNKAVAVVEVVTCDCLWRFYQKEAERIVAPGGVLIKNPIVRNRQINRAYAELWLEDKRFEWAGLAAFASKQVGCGLLHASEQIETMELGRDFVEYVYDMLAFGNTSLFLDIYPLHVFYKRRGLAEMKTCLKKREDIVGHPKFPVYWPAEDKVKFGRAFDEILPAFEAIDSGKILDGVRGLARHEQKNILQPIIYDEWKMQWLLQGNQAGSALSFAFDFDFDFVSPVQLTMANQCAPLHDGRSIYFSNVPWANLADYDERIEFVLKAAEQFHGLLNGGHRNQIEQSIADIYGGMTAK